jgi:YHS domain-containing protein
MSRAGCGAHWVLAGAVAIAVSGCGAGMAGMGGGCGMMGGQGGHGSHEAAAAEAQKAVCPVCGTRLTVSEATPRATYHEEIFYFVSEEHERLFMAEPEKYVAGADRPAPPESHEHH